MPGIAGAHEIPASVLLRLLIKADSTTLRVLVRAPLESMRDIDFPLRDNNRYLDIARAEPLLRQAATTWIVNAIRLYEGDLPLTGRIVGTRISLPSDRSFGDYDGARRHMGDSILSPHVDLPWQQAMLDVEIEYPIRSPRSEFSVDPALARLGNRTTTVMLFVTPAGSQRAFEYVGDPGLVRLDPRWAHAAGRFVALGFQHIMGGIDHLLFILCLVIPFRKLRPLISVVTAFTVAHSITLIGSAYGLAPDALWFPPLIEVLIALSILYMALENIIGAKLERRWVMAFLFGLVHGFGFSFALRESLQFAGSHLVTSLLSFNIGVEIGQVAVLLLAIPALNFLFTRVVAERMGSVILSAFVAHTAWHWSADRWTALRKYSLAAGSGTNVSWGLGWLLALILIAGIAVVAYWIARHRASRLSRDTA